MVWLLPVALIAIGGAVLVAVYVVLDLSMSRSKLRMRLRDLDKFTADKASHTSHPGDGNVLMRTALAMSERAVASRGDKSRIEAALDRADIALRPNEWILMRTGAAALGAVVLALALPWWVGLPLGGIVGWALPGMYRRMRVNRRTKRFADLLPESLQLVVSALRSGFSLPQAIDAMVREGPEPVNTEFGRGLAEIRLGGDMEDALERIAARNGSRDLAWLVMAVRIQREVGGNLSEILETVVETMRERGRLARHVRGLSAEGRMSAYVLIALPICVGGYMFVVRRDYLKPLYTEPLGLAMLGGAIVMLVAGSLWMQKVVKVEV
jgi:Flp pilus assembly protein TadB